MSRRGQDSPSRAQRIALAAAQAAIDEARSTPQPAPKKKRSLPAGRAVLLGAGLVTVGRVAAGPRARQLLGGLADRIEGLEERFSANGSS
jgi:hypothetical protein